MAKPLRMFRRDAGQATTELLLCSWVILFFMAAAIQLFKVDRAVFKSLTEAHATHFEEAFSKHNCYEDREDCTYDGGAVRTRVEWDPSTMPAVAAPIIGLFQSELGTEYLIRNDNPAMFTTACPTWQQCKRTKMAAGTYEPICNSFEFALETAVGGDMGATSGTCQAVNAVLDTLFGWM